LLIQSLFVKFGLFFPGSALSYFVPSLHFFRPVVVFQKVICVVSRITVALSRSSVRQMSTLFLR